MPQTILLADDSPHARRMGELYLTALGYEVVTVADGAAARQAMKDRFPALIIADAGLPGLPAAELCALAAVPVLVTVGALTQRGQAPPTGAAGVLRKPLSSAGLEDWLARLLPLGAATTDAAPPLSPREMLSAALHDAMTD